MNSQPCTTRPTLMNCFVRLTFVVMVAIAAFWGVRPVAAAQEGIAETAPLLQAEGGQTLLVHFSAESTPEMRDAVIAEMGGELVTWMHQIHVAEVRLSGQTGVSAASLPFSAHGIVTYAEEDMVVAAASVHNDPDLSNESMSYGLDQIHAIDAWGVITGSQQIVIAIIDSGIKLDHPEFAGRLVPGYDFVNNDAFADDDLGHGTHVAGIAAAALDNGQGIAGVCPNCRLMPVKVLNENNVGSWAQLAKGILFAVDNGAQILNLSLGATVPSETLSEAIRYALEHNVIVVAAAGNNSSDAPFYPAALDGVIAVGATTSSGERWQRSNYGSYIDLVAPGALIYSTYHDLNNLYYGYTFMSGTSMATPFVSGVAGLLLSANPSLTAQQVTEAMQVSAEDLGATGWDSDFGHGRVSALNALSLPVVGLVDKTDIVAAPPQRMTMYLPVLSRD